MIFFIKRKGLKSSACCWQFCRKAHAWGYCEDSTSFTLPLVLAALGSGSHGYSCLCSLHEGMPRKSVLVVVQIFLVTNVALVRSNIGMDEFVSPQILFSSKSCSQPSKLHFNGFSPVWVRKWHRSCLLFLNFLSHVGQGYFLGLLGPSWLSSLRR